MDSTAFTNGVASGDPLTDRVIIWTYLAGVEPGHDALVSWCVAPDHRLSHLVAQGSALAATARDHTVHVDVSGLEPGTTYFYEFDVPGAVSGVGRTRSLPAGHVEGVRFATSSCTKLDARPLQRRRAHRIAGAGRGPRLPCPPQRLRLRRITPRAGPVRPGVRTRPLG